ncbi:unnamed protein product, partial [Didymodactylos carnosus]
VYGVNTGFGNFAQTVIPEEQLQDLQTRLITSHCAGVGEPLSIERARMMFALRINILAKGYSGISRETLEKIIAAFNKSCIPEIPQQGTVGASGDLAPLAHLAAGLMGTGRMWSPQTGWSTAEDVLTRNGLSKVVYKPKEGLAMINGTQFITALGAEAVERSIMLARQADVIASLTIEALRGSVRAFDPNIHLARPHLGQILVAKRLRSLLASPLHPSEISDSHENCGKVQDAYSLRCIPQVHGISWDTIMFVHDLITTEMNSATDNPLVILETNDIISGGNFHGEYPAKALDYLGIAIHELASISECRMERLLNKTSSDLPAFLTTDGGLNSGFMIAHCTAAALVSENKVLCHPSSVDSIPTSAGQEDHVSMGGWSARKALHIVDNVEKVLAIELLMACQGLDLLKLTTTEPLEAVKTVVRQSVKPKVNLDTPDNLTTIAIGLGILELSGIDAQTQVITMNVNFELRWCDSLLIWNTSEYPCILSPDKQNSQIFFNAKEIWTPDITPINSPATLAKDQKLNYPVLSVCSDNIRWNYPEKLQTFCEINVKYFPFDRQRCSILLQSTIYDSSQMKLKTLYNFVRLYNYIKTEYSIIDASIHEIDLYNMYHKRNFSTLRIDIELERFSRFYTFKIVLPYFIISSLALFSFCLPIDTGEKVTLTVSVLLSLTIYLQLISDYVPKTEQGVCTLTLYCNFVFILVFLSCVCNTFIIFVYYTTSNTERRFILLKTGKMKKKKTMKKKKKRRQDNNGNMMSTIYKSIINLNRQRMKMNETKTDIIENEDNINAIELLNDIKYLKEILTHMYKQTCSTTTTEYNQINIIEQYDYFQIRQKSRIDNNKTEFNTYLTKHFSYKQLAIILDRILFIIYLIIMSLTGILFLNVQHSRSYALNGNRTSQLYDLRKKSTAIPLPLFRGCPK